MHPIEGKCETEIHDRILNRVYKQYKEGAILRNIEFSITKDTARNLIFNECTYCGLEGKNNYKKTRHLGIKYNGIDRINSKKGYIDGNVTSCCSDCNYAKNDLQYNEWIEYLKRISEYYPKNRSAIIDTINNELKKVESNETK